MTPPLHTYECPRCHAIVAVRSDHADVGHRCPNNRNRWTTLERTATT